MSKKIPNVFMAIPMRYHDGEIEPMTQRSLDGIVSFAERNQAYNLQCVSHKGMSVTQNSYRLVDKFLNDPAFSDCTHFLRTDDDMTYPPNAVQRLLDADKPLVVGCYTWRAPPYWVCADIVGGTGKASKINITREMIQDESICEINGAGSGFMLIKRGVLEDVARLWEKYHKAFKANMPEQFHGWEPVPYFPVLFNEGHMASTDFSFCGAVRAAGHKMYLHCGVVVGHIWKKQISVLDHLDWRETFGCSMEEQLYPLHEVKPQEYLVEAPKVEEVKALEPSAG